MKKIIITQRSEFISSCNEYRDSLDKAFVDLLGDTFHLIPIPSKTPNVELFCRDINCDGIILTGGNSVIPTNSDYCGYRHSMEQKLLGYSVKNDLPVVGICHGLQVINSYLGGDLKKLKGHVNKNHHINYEGLTFEVNSFHNYGISEKNLGKDLMIIGTAHDGTIEMVIHKVLPWLGMMWHPERNIKGQECWIKLIKSVLSKNIQFNENNIISFIRENT